MYTLRKIVQLPLNKAIITIQMCKHQVVFRRYSLIGVIPAVFNNIAQSLSCMFSFAIRHNYFLPMLFKVFFVLPLSSLNRIIPMYPCLKSQIHLWTTQGKNNKQVSKCQCVEIITTEI